MEEDNTIIEQTEDEAITGYSGKGGIPIGELITEAIRRCSTAKAKELTSGYWNTKFDKTGNAHKVWVTDTRKEYINCVEDFEIVLIKYIDKDYEAKAEKIRKKCDDCFKRFGFPLFKVKKVKYKDPESGYDRWRIEKEYTGKYSMPQISPSEDKAIVIDINKHGKKFECDWTVYYENYMDSLVSLYDEKRRELMKLALDLERTTIETIQHEAG